MGIENEIVHCQICEKEKLFSEIGRAEVIKGNMVYICKDCYKVIKIFKEISDTPDQRMIDEQHRY